MPGKVYCFNAYNESINQLTVNGAPAGRVSGWAASGSAIYTPSAIAVARARHGDGGAPIFASDTPTPVRVEWDSFSVQGAIDCSRLPNVSLDDDLIVYLAINQWTLMTTRGIVLLTIPVNPRAPWD